MTLGEFIKKCKENGIEENDQIVIKSWTTEYEIKYNNGIKTETIVIDK